jgi:hypothetical protein
VWQVSVASSGKDIREMLLLLLLLLTLLLLLLFTHDVNT